ncbi:hypothetical protein PV367_12340 [Streptomyces europaeiscabiei]|uniref:Uncharacterized protein n=1 Tax=Streptomyces europaeiscabiei TaxID=146819 RepID=A0AAJ2PP46_9ACTN|nr:hypothetical protein [Streptomyces europaeiscabiei]MDX3130566.1 hypothetical protein [Streptomyces europaeiscabiei]
MQPLPNAHFPETSHPPSARRADPTRVEKTEAPTTSGPIQVSISLKTSSTVCWGKPRTLRMPPATKTVQAADPSPSPSAVMISTVSRAPRA